MVNWTKKVLKHTITRVVAKCCSNWIISHNVLHCCVTYSSIKMGSSKLLIKSNAQKKMA